MSDFVYVFNLQGELQPSFGIVTAASGEEVLLKLGDIASRYGPLVTKGGKITRVTASKV